MKIFFNIAAALACLSAPVLAADMPSKLAPLGAAPVASFTWTGFYAGATLGGIADGSTFRKNGGPSWYSVTEATDIQTHTRGVAGGAELGYHYQIGQTVVGLVADYSFTSANGESNPPALYDAPYGVTSKSSVKSFGTVRAMGGVAFDRALVYATGGLAYGKVESSLSDYSYEVYSNRSVRAGWTAGAGLAYAISSNISVKAEALYYDLGKVSKVFVYSATEYGPYSDRHEGVVARLGLDYKFQ